MSTFTIYRFSEQGFQSQVQTNLLSQSSITLESMIEKLDNEYLKSLVIKGFTLPDPQFEYTGIFVFLEKPTQEDKCFHLNHLDIDISTIPINIAKISENAICYKDDSTVYDKDNRMTIREAASQRINAIYIPESQLQHIIENNPNLKFNYKI